MNAGTLARSRYQQHAQNFFIRAAVQRAVKRGCRGGRSGKRIDMRAAHTAHRVRGTILFVVGMQNEENVQSALQRGDWAGISIPWS